MPGIAELSEVLERIEIEIGGEKHTLLLPGSGRFEIENHAGDDWVLFCLPEGMRFFLINGDGEIIEPAAFPDACDNAAEWHQRRLLDLAERYNRILDMAVRKYGVEFDDSDNSPLRKRWADSHYYILGCSVAWQKARAAFVALEKGDDDNGD